MDHDDACIGFMDMPTQSSKTGAQQIADDFLERFAAEVKVTVSDGKLNIGRTTYDDDPFLLI